MVVTVQSEDRIRRKNFIWLKYLCTGLNEYRSINLQKPFLSSTVFQLVHDAIGLKQISSALPNDIFSRAKFNRNVEPCITLPFYWNICCFIPRNHVSLNWKTNHTAIECRHRQVKNGKRHFSQIGLCHEKKRNSELTHQFIKQ